MKYFTRTLAQNTSLEKLAYVIQILYLQFGFWADLTTNRIIALCYMQCVEYLRGGEEFEKRIKPLFGEPEMPTWNVWADNMTLILSKRLWAPQKYS
jgi:hypothetical protein